MTTRWDTQPRSRVSYQAHYGNIVSSPYIPNLISPDFFLFQRKKKSMLKKKHYDSVETVQQFVTRELENIAVQVFMEAYENWNSHWK